MGFLRRRGFTALEAALSLGIVLVCAMIAEPHVTWSRSHANLGACKANLRTIAGALEMYRLDTGSAAGGAALLPVLASQGYLQAVPRDPGGEPDAYVFGPEHTGGVACRVHGAMVAVTDPFRELQEKRLARALEEAGEPPPVVAWAEALQAGYPDLQARWTAALVGHLLPQVALSLLALVLAGLAWDHRGNAGARGRLLAACLVAGAGAGWYWSSSNPLAILGGAPPITTSGAGSSWLQAAGPDPWAALMDGAELDAEASDTVRWVAEDLRHKGVRLRRVCWRQAKSQGALAAGGLVLLFGLLAGGVDRRLRAGGPA